MAEQNRHQSSKLVYAGAIPAGDTSNSQQYNKRIKEMALDILAILCPDGALSFDDLHQCKNEKWIPIAVYRKSGRPFVICFTDPEVARKFTKRNYPKDWMKGIIALSKGELDWIAKKGWGIHVLTFPNLFKDRKDIEFGYEILEFQSSPDLFMKRD